MLGKRELAPFSLTIANSLQGSPPWTFWKLVHPIAPRVSIEYSRLCAPPFYLFLIFLGEETPPGVPGFFFPPLSRTSFSGLFHPFWVPLFSFLHLMLFAMSTLPPWPKVQHFFPPPQLKKEVALVLLCKTEARHPSLLQDHMVMKLYGILSHSFFSRFVWRCLTPVHPLKGTFFVYTGPFTVLLTPILMFLFMIPPSFTSPIFLRPSSPPMVMIFRKTFTFFPLFFDSG